MYPESRDRHEKLFACDVCDHPFATAGSMRRHKKAAHGDDVFKCPQPGCQFSSSWKASLTRHLKGFHGTAGSFFCDHPGCKFRTTWRESLVSHKRHTHSDKKPFSCNNTGCSYRCKTKSNLRTHQTQVHLKIRTKCCHVCDKRFFILNSLRAHMLSQHQSKDHDVARCDDCVTYLKKNHRMSQAKKASNKRKVERKRTHSTPPANAQDMECHEKKVGGKVENALPFKEEQVESQTVCLNDDLILMHMEMQLLSSL